MWQLLMCYCVLCDSYLRQLLSVLYYCVLCDSYLCATVCYVLLCVMWQLLMCYCALCATVCHATATYVLLCVMCYCVLWQLALYLLGALPLSNGHFSHCCTCSHVMNFRDPRMLQEAPLQEHPQKKWHWLSRYDLLWQRGASIIIFEGFL